MIIKCKDAQCDFRFVSKKDRLNELVKEKVEHEALTGHHVVFLLALGSKLVEKDNPEKLIKARCPTCWNNYGLVVVYETISKLDSERFIQLHNNTMAKKEKKLYQFHEFELIESSIKGLINEEKGKSQIVQKMIQDEIESEQIDFSTKSLEVGDQELAFFLRDPNAKPEETTIAYHIYKNICPVCRYFEAISSDDYARAKKSQKGMEALAELEAKKFDILLSHVRASHLAGSSYLYADLNLVDNILQMCILYQRNHYGVLEVAGKQKQAKRDKMAQALRTLNKTGIPYVLLSSMFDLETNKVGKYTYRGMEILGKPEWVQNVEAETYGDEKQV